jgi:uncharacterized protein (TIGR03000 family)
MRKVLVIAALAALAILLDSGRASAGRRCGGGGRHHRGGCGGGGGCGYGGGGCGGGGCGYGGGCGGGGIAYGGGWGGGYAYGGSGFMGGYVLQDSATAPGTTATVIVELPADAKLTIDGEATTSTSATRVFQTPELEPGKTFHYTLRAQVERDGKLQSVTRRVEVRAGEQTRVSLTPPAAVAAE